jgi:hypothetical protein
VPTRTRVSLKRKGLTFLRVPLITEEWAAGRAAATASNRRDLRVPPDATGRDDQLVRDELTSA